MEATEGTAVLYRTLVLPRQQHPRLVPALRLHSLLSLLLPRFSPFRFLYTRRWPRCCCGGPCRRRESTACQHDGQRPR